ncbi:MAG: hypothetical protein AAGE65_03845 [Planctomycetota bacterium]
MADPYERKPEPLEPEDDGLYELAEDPDAAEPSSAPPPPPGLMPDAAAGNDRLDPMLDDPAPKRDMKTGAGGKGAASHFSGDDPEYVNPEIARMRREEARIAAAAEEASAAALKQKVVLGVVGGLVVLAVVLYFVF